MTKRVAIIRDDDAAADEIGADKRVCVRKHVGRIPPASSRADLAALSPSLTPPILCGRVALTKTKLLHVSLYLESPESNLV